MRVLQLFNCLLPQGLRTLVVATKQIPEEEWAAWDARYQEAAADLDNRDGKVPLCAGIIRHHRCSSQKNVTLLVVGHVCGKYDRLNAARFANKALADIIQRTRDQDSLSRVHCCCCMCGEAELHRCNKQRAGAP